MAASLALACGEPTIGGEGRDGGTRGPRNGFAVLRRQHFAAGEQDRGQAAEGDAQEGQGTNRLMVAANAALPGLALAASLQAFTASSWRPSIHSTSP